MVAPEVGQTEAAAVATTATTKTTKTVNNAGGKSAPKIAQLGDDEAISSKKDDGTKYDDLPTNRLPCLHLQL